MFKDLNNEEKGEKITIKNSQEKILKISRKVEKISNEKTGIASLLIMTDNDSAFCSINGGFGYLRKAIKGSCEDNADFAELIKSVAAGLMEEELNSGENADMAKFIREKIQEKINEEVEDEGVSKFKDKDGQEGFAIDLDKIDEMTDKEVDDIVENMLKAKGIEFPKKDDESE